MSRDEPSRNGRWIASVVDRFEQPLVRYALHITGDLDAARDVVQETFLRLVRDQQRPESSVPVQVGPWLFRVCRNAALDQRKKESSMRAAIDLVESDVQAPEPNHVDVLERRESAAQVVDLLADLPANQQEVIRLRFEHGLSYREISEVTSLTVTNVGYLLHTAIQTLRKTLQPEAGV